MIPVLYAANTTDFSSFGLGVLTDTISCEVTEERNGIFECLLKYPVSGQHYGLITKECIIKAKPSDTAADQAFRIYRITKPLNGIVTIYGQHISYDLANVPVLPFSTESRSPQLILSQLLAGDTRFTGWTDYSDAKAFSVTQPKSVRACLGGTEGSMLSKWYGEFEWDNFTVKFHSHRGQKTGVVIEYGKNLTALEQDEDNSGVYGQEILALNKGYISLSGKVDTLESRVDAITNALIYRTPTSPQITSVKQIVDEKSQQTYAEAESLFVKGKLIDAYPLFKKAADNNCARAYYYLGEYYAEGYGHIVGNKSEALEYWRKGMSLGDILSTYQYGLLKYEDSEPLLNKWVKEHIHAVLQLVKENDSAAIVEFGWYILSKNPKDIGTLVDSLGYFKKAADNGYWPGAKMFYQFTEDLRRTGTNLQDYTALIQDVEHYETHALIGCTELFYKDDYVDSARHFQKSLWLRDDVVEPAGYLAFVLNTGLVPDSLADGFSRDIIPMYYNAGLKSDNAFTHYQLGALYYNGIGEKNYGKDLKKAYECFERSYSILPQGFVAGQLGYMFLTGEGVEENDKMAIHYLVEGDRLGDLNATMILSQCYEHGFGVKKDLQKSKALSEKGKQLSAPDTSTILKSYVEPMMTKHKEEEN